VREREEEIPSGVLLSLGDALCERKNCTHCQSYSRPVFFAFFISDVCFFSFIKLEPYWEIYRQHFRGHVIEWLEEHRIGNLSPEESEKARSVQIGDMFLTDPKRHPDLLPATTKVSFRKKYLYCCSALSFGPSARLGRLTNTL
jgi:hypothetical protein